MSLAKRCLQLITHQLHRHQLSVSNLAEELERHPDHVSTTFKAEMGETVSACINRLRIEGD